MQYVYKLSVHVVTQLYSYNVYLAIIIIILVQTWRVRLQVQASEMSLLWKTEGFTQFKKTRSSEFSELKDFSLNGCLAM